MIGGIKHTLNSVGPEKSTHHLNGYVSEKTKELMRSRMDVFGSFARFL
jgi:hypothetical protein